MRLNKRPNPSVTPASPVSAATPDGGAADGGERLPRQPHPGGDGGAAGDAGEEDRAPRGVQRRLDRPVRHAGQRRRARGGGHTPVSPPPPGTPAPPLNPAATEKLHPAPVAAETPALRSAGVGGVHRVSSEGIRPLTKKKKKKKNTSPALKVPVTVQPCQLRCKTALAPNARISIITKNRAVTFRHLFFEEPANKKERERLSRDSGIAERFYRLVT